MGVESDLSPPPNSSVRLSFLCPYGFVVALILQQSFKLAVTHINSHLDSFIHLGNLMLMESGKNWVEVLAFFLSRTLSGGSCAPFCKEKVPCCC